MNKISVVRATVECCLSGGCIAGGVECSKMKGAVKSSNDKSQELDIKNKNLEGQNKTLKDANTRINNTNVWYKNENEKLKNAIKYSAEWLNKLGTMGWEKDRLQQEAKNAKWGLKNDYLDKHKIDSTFHTWT